MIRVLLSLWAAWFCPPALAGEGQKVAIVVDLSGSMIRNDAPHYTAHFSKILADLLGPEDTLYVDLVPTGGSCNARLPSDMSFSTVGGDASTIAGRLDTAVRYGGGNNYGPAVSAAHAQLGVDRGDARMLLVIADTDWWNTCTGQCNALARELRDSGANVNFIFLGSGSPGAFPGDVLPARSADELLRRMGEVYQSFIGSDDLQNGEVSGRFSVEVHPFVHRAWLVVTGDGRTGSITQASGNPSAGRVALEHRQGTTVGGDGVEREYQIALLERPDAGSWSFSMEGVAPNTGWMLIQEYSLGISMKMDKEEIPERRVTRLTVDIVDEETGRRVERTDLIPGLDLTVQIDGETLQLEEDPTTPGRFFVEHKFDEAGRKVGKVSLETEHFREETEFTLEVVPVRCAAVLEAPAQARLGEPVLLLGSVKALGTTPPVSPTGMTLTTPEGALSLALDGAGRFSVAYAARALGTTPLTLEYEGDDTCDPGAAKLEVREWLKLRLDLPPELYTRRDVELAVQLVDADTGAPVPLTELPDTELTLELPGGPLRLTPDPGVPGRMVVTHRFETPGLRSGRARLTSPLRALELPMSLDVKPVRCELRPELPQSLEAGVPAQVVVSARATGSEDPTYATSLRMKTPDGLITLARESGSGVTYKGEWTPISVGTQRVSFEGVGGDVCAVDLVERVVKGRLVVSEPPPITGTPTPGMCEDDPERRCAVGELVLDDAIVFGDHRARLQDLRPLEGARVEILLEGRWQPLDGASIELPLSPDGPRRWPVRVRMERCCQEALDPAVPLRASLVPIGPDGPQPPVTVSLAFEHASDPWLHCWWRVLMGATGAAWAAFVCLGVTLPSSHHKRLTLALSSERQMLEEDLYPITQHAGTQRGFYRDAVAWICDDYAVRGRSLLGIGVPNGAFLRLRADGRAVRFSVEPGYVVETQDVDGGWAPVKPGEQRLMPSHVFRLGGRDDFYFTIRKTG